MTAIVGRTNTIARRFKRRRKHVTTKLNLVSLMDIFTILVFFLMLNTGEVEVLQPDARVALPKSCATLRPDASPVIKVNNATLYFKEEALTSIDSISSNKELIKPLLTRLEAYQKLVKENSKTSEVPENSISIMGDENLPYSVLKKVLYTCAQAGFRDVALAVEYSTGNFASEAESRANGAAS